MSHTAHIIVAIFFLVTRARFMFDSQILVPAPFVSLLYPDTARTAKPDWALLAQRHELCDDMAEVLTEHAKQIEFKLGLDSSDVLHKLLDGLLNDEVRLSEAEALWVVCRLAELLNWPVPADLADPIGPQAVHWLHGQVASPA